MDSGGKSDIKKARGLDGEIEKVFGDRERLNSPPHDIFNTIKIGTKLWILYGMFVETFLVHGCPVFLFRITQILLLWGPIQEAV